ncbi:DUF4249 domain-containing protein [Ancylomarina sp. YFZ004]
MFMRRDITFLLFLLCFLSSCIDSYNVDVKKYENLLVVDALITNENKSHQVKLTRSIANLDETPMVETKATVLISCNDGSVEILKEIEPGIYRTDSTKFVVEIGKTYQLKIQTEGGKSYSSDDCEILTSTDIDRTYFNRKDVVSVNNVELEGVSFFVDGKAPKDSYLRWIYEEDWKFSIPYPTLIGFDENKTVVYLPTQNSYCWKKSISHEIIIQSLKNQNSSDVKGKEVCFIPSDNTDRFSRRYAINVKQLNISRKEYEFWNKLKESSEEVGDIFGTQPFTIKGNVKSDDAENEPVLGYFQTGSVTSQRIFFDYTDVVELKLSLRNSRPICVLDTISVGDDGLNSEYEIYEKYVLDYGLGLHDQTDMGGGLILSESTCCDCSLTGSPKKPSFWED